jgi:hypothetical protein
VTQKSVPSTEPAAEPQRNALVRATAAVRAGHRHPNMGLAPIDMKRGFPVAAEKVRRASLTIAAHALEAAIEADPTIRERYDNVALRRLLRDGELVAERLSMCLAGDDVRWLREYAEWVAPIYRRRGVSLLDLAALCAGVRDGIAPNLGEDELAAADRAIDAATASLRKNSRIAGDRHKRNALWKWMYRGV